MSDERLMTLLHLRHGWGVEIEYHRHNDPDKRYRLRYHFFAIGYREYFGPTLDACVEAALAEYEHIDTSDREVTA